MESWAPGFDWLSPCLLVTCEMNQQIKHLYLPVSLLSLTHLISDTQTFKINNRHSRQRKNKEVLAAGNHAALVCYHQTPEQVLTNRDYIVTK